MIKYITYIMVVILILIFVGCKEDSVAPEYNYLPDTTARSKIVTSGFRYNGLNREYSVFLPKNYQSNMPLVLNLHAANFTMLDWMRYTGMNNVADTAGFIVVYPLGMNNVWNWELGGIEDVGFISALIDTLEIKYNIDMSRIYCAGASSGGLMTYRLIGELEHHFAAAAPVAASLFDHATNWKLTQFTPLLIISGTEDATFPYAGNTSRGFWSVEKTINYWIQNNNCSIQADTLLLPDNDPTDNSTIEKISWTNCSDNSSIVFYKVIGGAHHWPGGDIEFNQNTNGSLNNDINSSVEIWSFFKNQSNPLAK